MGLSVKLQVSFATKSGQVKAGMINPTGDLYTGLTKFKSMLRWLLLCLTQPSLQILTYVGMLVYIVAHVVVWNFIACAHLLQLVLNCIVCFTAVWVEKLEMKLCVRCCLVYCEQDKLQGY